MTWELDAGSPEPYAYAIRRSADDVTWTSVAETVHGNSVRDPTGAPGFHYALDIMNEDGTQRRAAEAAAEFPRMVWVVGQPVGHAPMRIGYAVSQMPGQSNSIVDLSLWDARGRRVRQLAHGLHAAGTEHSEWDLRDEAGGVVSAGLYLVRLQCAGRTTEIARAVVMPSAVRGAR